MKWPFYSQYHDYTLCFIGSPCCSVSYYNYISVWPYYIVFHWRWSTKCQCYSQSNWINQWNVIVGSPIESTNEMSLQSVQCNQSMKYSLVHTRSQTDIVEVILIESVHKINWFVLPVGTKGSIMNDLGFWAG